MVSPVGGWTDTRARHCLESSRLKTSKLFARRRKLLPLRRHCAINETVNEPRAIGNLALVGFMGTGKSAVGRLVATELGFAFVDTDELIEERVGRRIADLFAQEGEAAFRRLEGETVVELALRRDTVIATGGGLVVNPDNLASLKSHALVVCLWASPGLIFERTRHASHRPLLQTTDPLARIGELLAAREPAYRKADVLVNTEFRSIREVAQQVLHQFHEARRGSRAAAP
jgi:shikimate kinase